MNDDIAVTVVCLAYNHGKYIRQALEGFVTQKTSFKYEIIVHDDASTDDTAEIIREYAENYPDKIVPILQNENQYSKHVGIHKMFILPLVRGKYIALCEGDDYWVSSDKLQAQYEIMEAHPNIAMCVHQVQGVNEQGVQTERTYPNQNEFSQGIISIQSFLNHFSRYPFQTSSYFMKTDLFRELQLNPPQFRKSAGVGDEPMMLYMISNGGIYYLSECLSCYRLMSDSSWSKAMRKDFMKRQRNVEKRYKMMKDFDEYTEHKYDCHLSLYEGRHLLFSGNYKELWRQRAGEYYQQLPFKKKMAVLVGAKIPFMRSLIRNKL